jgi:two-component system nitrate/nitrite response regulator NarL
MGMMGPPQRTRVLIVDTHRGVRDGLAALLTCDEEFEVVGEADTEDGALAQALRLQPDLVLMDLELPSGSGEGALCRLRDAGWTGVVVATGLNGDVARLRRLLEGCCQGYIQKGARPEDVLRTVRAAVARSRN